MEEKQAKSEQTEEVPAVKRVEQTRVTTRRRSRTRVVIIVALFAMACAALLFWWLNRPARRLGSRRHGAAQRQLRPAGRGAPGGDAAAPGEATLNVAPEAAARAGVKVEAVGEQLAPEALQQAATGVVQANAYRSTPVVSLVGGRLMQVSAEAGQEVRRGQQLAVIFSDELAMAQSRYLSAQAELEEHHQHHQRTTRLVELGAASREEFEQATSVLKKAEAEMAAQRQRLLLLGLTPQRVAALRGPAQVSSEISLPAPTGGTVISRAANPGEVVEANKELLRVADLSNVWVVGQVFERDLARVRTGSGASVTSEAYPGRVWRGRVTYVDPQLDPSTRTAQVRVEVANPGQRAQARHVRQRRLRRLRDGRGDGADRARLGGADNRRPHNRLPRHRRPRRLRHAPRPPRRRGRRPLPRPRRLARRRPRRHRRQLHAEGRMAQAPSGRTVKAVVSSQ